MSNYIIQISPEYPPNSGGVGHYACRLANFLRKKSILSKFLISDLSKIKLSKQEYFGSKSSDLLALLEKYNSKEIILHYSGYGYSSKGLCFDLISSLEKWKMKNKNNILITIFHEIYATGPIYKTSFWTSIPQKYLAKNLLELTDFAITTTKKNQMLLSSFNKKKLIKCLHVFSTIGEKTVQKKINKRKKMAVIFGGNYQKKVLYKNIYINSHQYADQLKKLGITKIVDVGPKLKNLKKIVNIPIKQLGIKSNNFISNLLCNSRAGLVYYPACDMGKSSIVAAYTSHGVLIINFCKDGILKSNEFISGRHFVSNSSNGLNNFNKIVNSVYKLYKQNNVAKLGSLIICFLKMKRK